MQIVIDIEKKDYDRICGYSTEYIQSIFSEAEYRAVIAIRKGTPLPKGNKCKWIHYDYRTMCPKEHDINNPFWMIPEIEWMH